MQVLHGAFTCHSRCGGEHIALRSPAPSKPRVYIHVHPLGGAKQCFAEGTPEPLCLGWRTLRYFGSFIDHMTPNESFTWP